MSKAHLNFEVLSSYSNMLLYQWFTCILCTNSYWIFRANESKPDRHLL